MVGAERYVGMARTAAARFWSQVRACTRTVRRCLGGPSWLAAALILTGSTLSGVCQAEPVKGEATLTVAGGYARLVLKLADDVESDVTTAGTILLIKFKRLIDIPIDRVFGAAPDYVTSARRDPDGSAIRLSLARKVTINTMTAGERVFIDMLPDNWKGQPPGLPSEVVRELSERARVAERALRQQRAVAEAKKRPPVRIRASVQPTFVRFVFETPDGVGVSSVLNDQKLTLFFNAALTFDLADAKLAAPSNIASINQKVEGETSAVEVMLIGDVDVHSFREDKNYIIDVAYQQTEKPAAFPSFVAEASHAPATAAPATAVPAPTVPARPAPVAAAPERPARESSPSWNSGASAPPTSELIAEQANIEIKPEAAPKLSPAPEPPMPARSARETTAPAAEAPPKVAVAAS